MKYNKLIGTVLGVLCTATAFTACDNYLERAPLSSITPEVFFYKESDLNAYIINQYNAMFPSPADGNDPAFLGDGNSDNQLNERAGINLFVPGNTKKLFKFV